MERDIIVKFMNGQQIVGSLRGPFKPRENKIELSVAESDDRESISVHRRVVPRFLDGGQVSR